MLFVRFLRDQPSDELCADLKITDYSQNAYVPVYTTAIITRKTTGILTFYYRQT